MLRDALASIVTAAVRRLIEVGELPRAAGSVAVDILDTKQPEHGDYATNFALVASKAAGSNPRALAEKLRAAVLSCDESGLADSSPAQAKMVAEGSPVHPDARRPLIHEIDIAGPGFMNFRLKPESVAAWVPVILGLAENLPQSKVQSPKSKVNVEFVSVNPNGPITVGSGRGAAFGDTLCRVLAAAGNQVHREYYVNDGVNSEQMRLFAESVRHYYHAGLEIESTFPEQGYRGEYVQDVARQVQELYGPGHDREDTLWFQRRSEELMLDRQRKDLHTFGVDFDTWFSEQSLHESGEVAQCLEELQAKGAADEEPYRTVVKLGKSGVIEEVTKQSQAGDDDEAVAGDTMVESTTAPRTGSAAVPPAQSVTGASTLWLRSTKFGDDMDRVLRRRDSRLTYIASDVAYHKDKLTDQSGLHGTGPVDKLITILGPDHHGYIARLQAVVAALLETPTSQAGRGPDALVSGKEELSGNESLLYDSSAERDACQAALDEAKKKLEVVIFQIVRFVKDGKPAPMRKRDGNIYELRDLINELGAAVAAHATKEDQQRIGADVARFFYLMRSHDTHMDFDIDLATKQSDENPVFYVQYAYARISGVLRKAEEAFGPNLQHQALNTSILTHDRELALIKKILDLPWEVSRCAEDYGVHRLTTYAIELARTYHHFYDGCRVIQPDQPDLTVARLALCEASRIALKATFDLLGVSAPERMEREVGPGLAKGNVTAL